MPSFDNLFQPIKSNSDNNDYLRRKASKTAADLSASSEGQKTFNFKGVFASGAQPKWRYGSLATQNANSNIVQ